MYYYITHEGNLNLLYYHVHQALFLPTPLVCLTFWCDLLALCFQVCFSIIFPQHISLPFLLFDKIDILSSHIYLCLVVVVVVIVYILISPSHSKPPTPCPQASLSLSLSLSLFGLVCLSCTSSFAPVQGETGWQTSTETMIFMLLRTLRQRP